MHQNKIKSPLILALSLFFTQNALSQVTSQQQEVLDDYMAMRDMSIEERRDYRQQVFADKTPQQNKAYTQAFKQVRPMLPDYLGLVDGQDPAKLKQNTTAVAENKNNKSVNRTPGTNIQYDTGVVFGGAGVASQMLGNRFDSALNTSGTMCCFPVESSGSITMVTFNMVNTFFNSVVFSLYSNITGTMADQVTSMAFAGRMTGLNTVTIGTASMGAYQNGAFLAGIWQFDPTMTGLAIDTGTTGGQGFHGISLNDAAVGTMLTPVTTGGGMGVNAIFRVSGNVATPVELINFTVE